MASFPDPDRNRLADLEKRIEQAEKRQKGESFFNPFAADRQSTKASRVAIEFLVSIGVFFGIGYVVDGQFETSPWGVLIGLFAGFVVGIAQAYRAMSGVDRAVGWRKREDDKGPDQSGGTT